LQQEGSFGFLSFRLAADQAIVVHSAGTLMGSTVNAFWGREATRFSFSRRKRKVLHVAGSGVRAKVEVARWYKESASEA
jgi:hypothetical protein